VGGDGSVGGDDGSRQSKTTALGPGEKSAAVEQERHHCLDCRIFSSADC